MSLDQHFSSWSVVAVADLNADSILGLVWAGDDRNLKFDIVLVKIHA
jgi:hypothetical protein